MPEQSLRISRETGLSAALICSILVFLTAFEFGFPASIHDALVFDHSDPTVWALWMSAYVHAGRRHLFLNLYGFLLAVIPAWGIFVWRDRQQTFRRVLLVYLVVFPPLISASSFAVYQFWFHAETAATRGFSGIVGAILGLLFVSVLEVAYDKTDWTGVAGVGMLVLLVTMLRILIRAGEATLLTLSLGMIGVLLSVSLVVPVRYPQKWNQKLQDEFIPVSLISYGATALVVMLPRLFPIRWIQPNRVTDIFGHAAGVLLGILSGAVLYWSVRDD